MIAAAALALPGQAFALTVSTLDQMPFETAAQEAGHLTWQSNSKISTSGNARIAAGNTYPKTLAYDFVSVGDTLTLQNVGTDAEGNAYDLKMTLASASGKTLDSYFSEGWHKDEYVAYYASNTRIQVCLSTYESVTANTPQVGERMSMCIMNHSSGDCTLRFQYVKHGTANSASAAMFWQIYDIDTDNYSRNTFARADMTKYTKFNGCEGINVSGANLYLPKDSKLSSNTDGDVWISAANAGNTDNKDWSKGVCVAGTSATTSIMFTAYDNVDIYFDNQLLPDSPSKDAEITE